MQGVRREGKETKQKIPKNILKKQTRSPLMKIVQNSVREPKKNPIKFVLNSPPRNAVAVEMAAAFATNDSILIPALCISSPCCIPAVSSRSKNEELCRGVLLAQSWLCLPVSGTHTDQLPPWHWDFHQLIKCTRALWVNTYHGPKDTWGSGSFRDFINFVQIRRHLSEPPLAATAIAWGAETSFRRVTQCLFSILQRGRRAL